MLFHNIGNKAVLLDPTAEWRSLQLYSERLKRFRHPNIVVLYGYSLNANSAQQCLVYEHAANGSLAGFFTDDGNRARLSADTRLSIMFKLVRAVHFLHTGGCKVAGKSWKVFHRDIKSANICLAEDFTPRLIDCGLAKFVPDDNSRATPGSLQSTNGAFAFGTRGYMCPEYVKMKSESASWPYIAAYDVFSVGVVLVELIVGCVTGGLPTTNGVQLENAYRRYVKDGRDRPIRKGWKKLMDDADPTIIWNPASLQLLCKAAIACMAPLPDKRLSTKELLDKLRDAINLNADEGIRQPDGVRSVAVLATFLLTISVCFAPDLRVANFLIIGVTIFAIFASHVSIWRNTNTGRYEYAYCETCHRYRSDFKCSKGHALCTTCIVDKLCDENGCQLVCLIQDCPSKIHDKDLYGRIPVETYKRYVEQRADQTKVDECLRQVYLVRSDIYVVHVGVEHSNELLQKQQHMLQRLAKGLDRSLAALALLSANQFKKCPNLVLMTPLVFDEKFLKDPMGWSKDKVLQKYSVVFICAHSGVPGHEPFEIEMPRGWIVKVAPWLKVCLWVIKKVVEAYGVPLPIPPIPILDQCEKLAGFLDSVIDEAAGAVLDSFQAFLENDDTTPIEACGKMHELTGAAYELIAEKAQKDKRRHLWMPPKMVPVVDQNGTTIWVTGDCAKKHYGVRVNHEDDTTST
ncbi:serine/threonine kinase [Fragilaria crotonensis]|nr:serine/threonine kinase [Fragilaria crotonensis]